MRFLVLDSDNRSPALTAFIEELAIDPDAPLWARDCRWVPGTGYCRNRPCRGGCLFRRQREDEARSLLETRRQRFVGRRLPLLCLSSLATFVDMI